MIAGFIVPEVERGKKSSVKSLRESGGGGEKIACLIERREGSRLVAK